MKIKTPPDFIESARQHPRSLPINLGSAQWELARYKVVLPDLREFIMVFSKDRERDLIVDGKNPECFWDIFPEAESWEMKP